MTKVKPEPTCTCFVTPEEGPKQIVSIEEPHRSGCMVCGADLVYNEIGRDDSCHYCGQIVTAIQWGQDGTGGACAFLGAYGAANGVAIAVSILLGVNPYNEAKRQTA
jgi:hypothetical protein